MTQSSLRRAGPADLDALQALERACFPLDAQSRRSLRWLLTRANAVVLVMSATSGVRAALIQLYRANSQVARVYSIAVAAESRGLGLAGLLLDAATDDARTRGCRWLRAEVRESNRASRGFFRGRGFRETATLAHYYPDGEHGLRLELNLEANAPGREARMNG